MKYPLTLRGRIACCTAAITAFALIVLAAGTWFYVYLEDLEAIDGHLAIEILAIRADIANGEVEADEFEEDEFEHGEGLAVIEADGALLGRTPSFPLEIVEIGREDLGFSIQSYQGSRWRIYSSERQGVVVVTGFELEEFDDILDDLASIQFLLVPLVSLFTAWMSWLVAGRSLAPIRDATATAAKIGTNDLSARLPIIRSDDEIGQFTEVLNGMLDRIEKSYLQAKRFAGDASHELSTPLTIIKGELEKLVANHQLSDPAEQGIVSAQQEVDRMHQIIDQLLILARFDAGKASADYAPINLSKLLDEMAEDVDMLSENQALVVKHKIDPGLWVKGDFCQLHRLFLNLFSNATKYNGPGGLIDYQLRSRNGLLQFTISNSGPQITETNRERIFERFFQTDESHATRGNGLGLSLCREIAHAHGGTIRLVSSTVEVTEFLVELPQVSPG
ncbi:MAG: HAMP domain-containing protein [Opitutaceae bacterium]|nr:HAMP domain-containing protein [Opitutaceae bacterium]